MHCHWMDGSKQSESVEWQTNNILDQAAVICSAIYRSFRSMNPPGDVQSIDWWVQKVVCSREGRCQMILSNNCILSSFLSHALFNPIRMKYLSFTWSHEQFPIDHMMVISAGYLSFQEVSQMAAWEIPASERNWWNFSTWISSVLFFYILGLDAFSLFHFLLTVLLKTDSMLENRPLLDRHAKICFYYDICSNASFSIWPKDSAYNEHTKVSKQLKKISPNNALCSLLDRLYHLDWTQCRPPHIRSLLTPQTTKCDIR